MATQRMRSAQVVEASSSPLILQRLRVDVGVPFLSSFEGPPSAVTMTPVDGAMAKAVMLDECPIMERT